jgi:hypothetical protein
MTDDFSVEVESKKINPLTTKIKTHLEHPKHRFMAVGTVIFLVIMVLFL